MHTLHRDPQELEKYTGYRFQKPELLLTALTHSSYINECRKGEAGVSNERMEFLGDAVLQIIISDFLYTEFPHSAEGMLTKFRQQLVCENTLAKMAGKIHLGEFLILGKGEEQNSGRTRASILADAFEAYLAAVYLDSDHDTTFLTVFLHSLMRSELEHCEHAGGGDFKTRLQQLVQQDGHEHLYYEVIDESGPEHAKIFGVRAMLNSNPIGYGKGRSKREAEQAAAKEALRLFGVND